MGAAYWWPRPRRWAQIACSRRITTSPWAAPAPPKKKKPTRAGRGKCLEIRRFHHMQEVVQLSISVFYDCASWRLPVVWAHVSGTRWGRMAFIPTAQPRGGTACSDPCQQKNEAVSTAITLAGRLSPRAKANPRAAEARPGGGKAEIRFRVPEVPDGGLISPGRIAEIHHRGGALPPGVRGLLIAQLRLEGVVRSGRTCNR